MTDYDQGWTQWSDMIRYSPAPFHRRRLILALAREIDFGSVLDVGCGPRGSSARAPRTRRVRGAIVPDTVRRGRWAIFIVLALVAVLAARRIGPDILYYDEGVYVASAWSIASGSGYRNPCLPDAPPQAKYPPAVPLVFSAVWRLLPRFPDNLVAMKWIVLASGVGTVALSWTYLRSVLALGAFDAFAMAAVLGAAPFFVVFSTLATSDIPSLLLTLAALLLYERSRRGDGGIRFGTALVVAALAFLTRTTALFLFAAFFVDLVRERRRGRALACAVVCGLVAAPWFVWSHWASALYAHYPPEVRSNYVGYASAISSTNWIGDSARVTAFNLRLLVSSWGLFVLPWVPARPASLAVLGALAAVVLRHRRPSLNTCTLYCAFYAASIIIVPYPDTRRYALAIMPFLIAVFVQGVRAIVAHRTAATLAVAALAVAALYTDLRVAWHVGAGRNEALFDEFHRTTRWVADHLPSDAILVGDYDPGYFLYGRRRAIRLSVNDNFRVYYTDQVSKDFPEAPALATSFQRMGACYFVRDPMIGGPEGEWFGALLDAVQAAARAPFATVYSSPRGWFTVYRRTDCPPTAAGS